MVFNIDNEYQLVFGDDYFFYNESKTSRKQLISSFTKDILTSITLQDDNQYWVYNLISRNMMFQSGPKGNPKLIIAFRENYENRQYEISLGGIGRKSLDDLKHFLDTWTGIHG